jgi:hypothetical protein
METVSSGDTSRVQGQEEIETVELVGSDVRKTIRWIEVRIRDHTGRTPQFLFFGRVGALFEHRDSI